MHGVYELALYHQITAFLSPQNEVGLALRSLDVELFPHQICVIGKETKQLYTYSWQLAANLFLVIH